MIKRHHQTFQKGKKQTNKNEHMVRYQTLQIIKESKLN